MTAYGAVNSLRNTIDYILHSSHFSLVDPSPRILQLAYEELNPLQDILIKLDRTRTSKSRKKVNALDGRIKELIWEFEDLMESLLYKQIVSQVEDEGMKERVWEFQGLLESLPSQPQPQPQILFQSRSLEDDVGSKRSSIDLEYSLEHYLNNPESLPSQPQILFQSPHPHHSITRRRRKLVVHKHKGRKFNTPRIMSESEASQSRSIEDDVGGKRFSIDQHHVPSLESLTLHPQPQPQSIFQSPPHHITTTSRRRKLVVHKHKGRKFNTPRIMSESEASQSRSIEDDVGGGRFSIDQHHVPSLESLPSQPQPQFIFQSPPPPHKTTTSRIRRKLVVHKHKGRKFDTRGIMSKFEASQSRSIEDDDGGERMRFSIDQHHVPSSESLPSHPQPQPQPQFIFQSAPPHHKTTTSRSSSESLPSNPQPQQQFIFQSPPPHHKTTSSRSSLESLPSHPQPQPQFIFQSPPPHHKTTTSRRRKLVVHKHKGRKFNTPRIMNESEASHSRSLEDDVGGKRFTIHLHCLEDDVCSLMERLKDMEEEYIYEVGNMPEDDEDQSIVSSRSGTKSKMIGLSDQFQKLKRNLLESYDMKNYTALVGTAGVGKTALAEAIFEDPDIVSLFEHRAWVTVGRKSQFDEVSRGITQGDDELGAYLEERLKGKKCLIVLDDVWETQILDSLTSSLQNIFDRSIQILVTTRNRSITFSMIYPTSTIVVRFLNEEESKELLCEKVFGEKDCPFQLDKAAIKIAKNCEGLPLMIVTVADILSKTRNTNPKYWEDVAEMRNSVFTDAYNEISKVLFPSYDYLPQYLKMPFLYIGVFPLDYDIPISKIINMLANEGWFHNTNTKQSLEDFVWKCVHELCTNRNLALYERSAIYRVWWRINNRKYKTCRLHSSWRYVCRGEARKNKFYHVLKKLVDGSVDIVKGQRCLCLENNILFGIKDFCNSVRLNCPSSTRSLLYFGPYHQYPISIGDDFKLLGKLDALNLRLYTFPTEILTLVLLKYLALTCNGNIPTTISKLFNLRVLIIHPHNNITSCIAPSYVPIQIWDMQDLEHIEILGKSLVAPCHSASLKNLLTFVGVNTSIYTILELSKKVPCIRKLGVRIEMTPYDDHSDLLSCFGCISTLGSLETLQCSIINPVFKYDYVFPSSFMLPSGLKKLHLSGMGCSWEYMDVIGSLPFLEVLKLRAYAFRGSKWEAQEGSFMKLGFLLIEDSDLVQWKPEFGSFPDLTYLSMKHCYKLEEIHWPSKISLGSIELVNCNPIALTCAKQLQLRTYASIEVTASSSFDEKPIAIKFKRYWYEE